MTEPRAGYCLQSLRERVSPCYGLTVDTQKDMQPPKQQPMIYICEECHTKNEISSKDSIRCRECVYQITYKKRTKRSMVSDSR
ncbi:DNA-directed RNA polymerases I, II, and III subunit RPABC4-like [Choloepus didactylus]|uniref:DNA-directed RNA polymerases I, II, and III subunit RPABC4-like n=1 Tax=Choloepus didactylus TaxID=27675 RepID=UPI00189CE528|nr:DNA-directed RNA polymerases I, II, and III subunit RPABC4-like [Choloepus didactylus]